MSEARRALVVGGTGAVGSAAVRALCQADIVCSFTYLSQRAAANTLCAETNAHGHPLDATDTAAVRALLREIGHVDIFVHCAAKLDTAPFVELSDEAFEHSHALNARSAFVLCREIGRSMIERGSGDILLVGGMDRAQ